MLRGSIYLWYFEQIIILLCGSNPPTCFVVEVRRLGLHARTPARPARPALPIEPISLQIRGIQYFTLHTGIYHHSSALTDLI